MWTSNDRFYCAARHHDVSMVRPNESTVTDWKKYWASLQGRAPGAAPA